MLVPCTCAAFADSPCATNALSATAACATIVRRTRGTGENGGGTLCPHHQILGKGQRRKVLRPLSSTFYLEKIKRANRLPVRDQVRNATGAPARKSWMRRQIGTEMHSKNRSIAMTMHAKTAEQQNKRKNTADPQGNQQSRDDKPDGFHDSEHRTLDSLAKHP